MWQLLQRYRSLVVMGVMLAMPLVLLYAQTKKPGARGPVVGVVVDIAGGIERALLWTTGGILDAMEHYVTSVGSYEELVRLRRRDQDHEHLETRIAELRRENDELRALAQSMERIDGPRPLGARVIGRAGAPLSRILTIDRGAADGVRRGDGVVDKDGVVGQVLVIGRESSDVLLLTDPTSAVDVVVQRSRARGVLRGVGDDDKYRARVEDFDKLRDVRLGDVLVTSGIGARFPTGLLVGTVVSAESPDDALYLKSDVQPAVRFDRVEHVAVLVHRDPPRAPHIGNVEVPKLLALDPNVSTKPSRVVADKKAPKPEPKADPKPDVKSDVKPDAKPEPKHAGDAPAHERRRHDKKHPDVPAAVAAPDPAPDVPAPGGGQ